MIANPLVKFRVFIQASPIRTPTLIPDTPNPMGSSNLQVNRGERQTIAASCPEFHTILLSIYLCLHFPSIPLRQIISFQRETFD